MGNQQLITIFGRKPVLEVLRSDEQPARLHIDKGIKKTGIITDILDLAADKAIEVRSHSRRQLSYISKNSRQDQGVALDLPAPNLGQLEHLPDSATQLLVVDGVTNPQNLGIIIRSVTASPMDGLVLPKKGNAGLSPLVYKSSAGTVVSARIYQCDAIAQALTILHARQFQVVGLTGEGTRTLNSLPGKRHTAFVLGNETDGLAEETRLMCDELVNIPMANGVESLNVSAAASIVAFHSLFI